MSLKIHRAKKVIPNAAEELQAEAFKVFKADTFGLLNKAWKFDTQGKVNPAMLNYKAVWVYHLMVHLAYNMRQELDRLGITGQTCNSAKIEDKYKLECIEGNLSCLSKTYGTDYKTAWDKILTIYGISRETKNCNDCCLGIGEMAIAHPDECLAFILGPCVPEDTTLTAGEFSPCEFAQNEVTEASGDDIYLTCNL